MKTKKDTRKSAAEANGRIRRKNRGEGFESADWLEADSGLVQQAIHSVARRGCAIQFSYTRDGGAFCIRIVGDGEPYNEYVRPTENVNLYLTGLIEDFSAE